jgi:hypothetical protein
LEFGGPFAIAISRGTDWETIGTRFNILVPVTGTDLSVMSRSTGQRRRVVGVG